MYQGHYISMNTIMLSFVMLNKVISIIYCLLYKSLSSCAIVLYINPESWPVVGFCPHVGSTGVFGVNLITLYPSFGSFEGGVQHNELGNRTIGLYHSHLAIGALEREGRRCPWCSEDRTRGPIST